MPTSNVMRRLATSTAVVLAFSPLAQAAGLIDDDAAVNRYTASFLTAVAKISTASGTGERARGFVQELETALRQPSDKTRVVDYPPRANAELLRITSVVPPKGFEALDIPVCAEQHNKVLATWNITAKGNIVPAPWVGATVSETPTAAACKAFILAARADINQKLAETQPAQPPAN